MIRSKCGTFLLLGFAALQVAAAEPAARTLVVGHRGLMHAAPENTIAAFRACLALRIGFEFDVRRTKDGQLVCLHDDTLQRTTDGTGRLADWTLADVRRLDAGGRFDAAFRDERVPTIEEILALAGEQSSNATLLAVDLKDAGDGLEEAVVQLAEKYKAIEQLVFIGLTIESPEIRARLRAASPRAKTARLAATSSDIEVVLADSHADYIYVRFLPTAEQVGRIHAQGKRLFLAGPLVAGSEPDNWKKAAALGLDAVLTDYPIEMRQQIRAGVQ